jgi:hypothetical protein
MRKNKDFYTKLLFHLNEGNYFWTIEEQIELMANIASKLVDTAGWHFCSFYFKKVNIGEKFLPKVYPEEFIIRNFPDN